MPKNQVTDPITDLEMAFARLVLSGTMTDRQAAETVGLNPDTAAYTKAKPRVHNYMIEHRAAVQELFLQQEAEGLRRQRITREQVLDRLWEIATMNPEMTKNSVTGQIKAISMIVAIEGLIPDRRAAEKKSAAPPPGANIFEPAWLLEEKAKAAAARAGLDLVPRQKEPAIPDPSPTAAPDNPPAPSPVFDSSEPNDNLAQLSETVPAPVPVQDPPAALSIKKPYVKRYGPF